MRANLFCLRRHHALFCSGIPFEGHRRVSRARRNDRSCFGGENGFSGSSYSKGGSQGFRSARIKRIRGAVQKAVQDPEQLSPRSFRRGDFQQGSSACSNARPQSRLGPRAGGPRCSVSRPLPTRAPRSRYLNDRGMIATVRSKLLDRRCRTPTPPARPSRARAVRRDAPHLGLCWLEISPPNRLLESLETSSGSSPDAGARNSRERRSPSGAEEKQGLAYPADRAGEGGSDTPTHELRGAPRPRAYFRWPARAPSMRVAPDPQMRRAGGAW